MRHAFRLVVSLRRDAREPWPDAAPGKRPPCRGRTGRGGDLPTIILDRDGRILWRSTGRNPRTEYDLEMLIRKQLGVR